LPLAFVTSKAISRQLLADALHFCDGVFRGEWLAYIDSNENSPR
jgi:hypothetical protein